MCCAAFIVLRSKCTRCKAIGKLYDQNCDEWIQTHCNDEDARAYDAWKDAYRNAFAEYEAASEREDWYEAARWKQIFDELYEPRRRHRIAHLVHSND